MMRTPAFQLLPRPAPMDLRGRLVLVLGFGDTGLSLARWAEAEGARVRAADTRQDPPAAAGWPGALHRGPFTAALLEGVDLLCISPGLPLEQEVVAEALRRGVPVAGDIELFAWRVRRAGTAKVLAVTGTNGKTTVTALTGHLLRTAGVDAEVAGNIAPPALEALLRRREAPPAAWALELSSYQLETTWSLAPDAAAMLNLTEDHLDRYAGLAEYGAAKARIFEGARLQVVNRDDPASLRMARPGAASASFGLGEPAGEQDFGVRGGWLAKGGESFLPARELPIHGAHNVANALAAAALACAAGLSLAQVAQGLRTFRGLPHRVQLVASRGGVDWYDDSKGTNVGATVAALDGLGRPVVLIAGGEGKGQDFSPLAAPVARTARSVLLIGRDAPILERALAGLPVERCASLEAAVARAAALARPGDAVLLSPACASFDMFRNYRHRGEAFAEAVGRLG